MAYKKDQGRYARMIAFWSLFLLFGWGCLRADGLVGTLRHWFSGTGDGALLKPWIDPFPLLGKLDLPMVVAMGVLAVFGAIIYRWLNRPNVADLLVETESEMRKVTWPTAAETWRGTLAVVVTVVFLLAYLTIADTAIIFVLKSAMGAG